MKTWPNHPMIYEINTWVWLNELSFKYGKRITFSTVPKQEWDNLSSFGFDAVWFMGVWERSPAGIAVANRNKGLSDDFHRALSDFHTEDNVGSPYCVRKYAVDKRLGGRKGLAKARKELSKRGLKLVLDFVPNHVAPDHSWVMDHPKYFIAGNADDFKNDPASFLDVNGRVFACGRDPFFPAWPDVLQLNAFNPKLRQAAIETLSEIADQCDGVRCDMAMLIINNIFERTWGNRAGQRPETEYWVEVISAVKKSHSDFLFVAEAYWDLEWELLQQGFDYCYDKRLYDRLEKDTAENVRLHLCADTAYQTKMVRFIENHDEPRALSAFPSLKSRAAAVIISTIPGAKLFHEGQFMGMTIRLPIFLGRRSMEPEDFDLLNFYRALIQTASKDSLRNGEWRLCNRTGWPDNTSYQNLIAWCWRSDRDKCLVVVNFSSSSAQGHVRLPWEDLNGIKWRMTDYFSRETYERNGDEMLNAGLYVDLPPWGFHLLADWTPTSRIVLITLINRKNLPFINP